MTKAAFILILGKAESAFWNADSKRRSKTPLIQAIVRAQVNRKAFIWRHLNVVICDFAFMLPPESAFCSNHDRKRTFLACVHAYFAKAFWNADSKRRSRKYCSCFPREKTIRLPKKACLGILGMFNSRLLFELKWTGKAFIWRHLNVVIMWFCVHASPESAFCSNHDRKRTFLGVWIGVLKRVYFENKHGRNSILL